jgi:hypothetical protein
MDDITWASSSTDCISSLGAHPPKSDAGHLVGQIQTMSDASAGDL